MEDPSPGPTDPQQQPPHPPTPPPHAHPHAPQGHRPPQQESASPLDAIIPTNPLAAISCYMGIFSMILCIAGPLLGPLAILLGVLGLKKWNVQESAYGKTTSTIRAWIGIVTGSLGTLIGIAAIVMIIIAET
ncbi:hypothetical protein OT109_12720 [Phycisphaeraceae bacterium D3-23]